MSLIDTLKGLVGKGKEVAADNADKIHDAVDKAGGFIDEKTGGKYSDQIGKGAAAVKNAIPEQPGSAESGAPAEPASAPESASAPTAEPEASPTPAAEPAAAAEPAPSAEAESEAAPKTETAPENDSKPESPQG